MKLDFTELKEYVDSGKCVGWFYDVNSIKGDDGKPGYGYIELNKKRNYEYKTNLTGANLINIGTVIEAEDLEYLLERIKYHNSVSERDFLKRDNLEVM